MDTESRTPDAVADALRERMQLLQSRLNAAKIAFLNRTELDGKIPDYNDVKLVAKELIQTNYDLQVRQYGKIRMKLSVAKLLRRGA
jgi:hypothetical protein